MVETHWHAIPLNPCNKAVPATKCYKKAEGNTKRKCYNIEVGEDVATCLLPQSTELQRKSTPDFTANVLEGGH